MNLKFHSKIIRDYMRSHEPFLDHDEIIFYLKIQSVPRSKHTPLACNNFQLVLYSK